MLRRRVEELPRDLCRLGERAIGETAFVVQLLLRRTVDRKRVENRERLLDDSIGVARHRVDRDDGMDEVAGQRHELGRGRVAQPELVADSFLHSVLEDAHRSGERARPTREQRERDHAERAFRIERGQLQLLELARLGRRQELAGRKGDTQLLRRAGQPDRGVPANEPSPRPRCDVVRLERAQAVLVVAHEPVLARAEPQREGEPGRIRALQRLLCEEDVAFRLEPLERKRTEPSSGLREEREHEIRVARRPEAREDVVDAAVPAERSPSRDRKRQVLDEMGDPAARRALVTASDPDEQRADERRRAVREEDRHTVDRGSFDLRQTRSSDPRPRRTGSRFRCRSRSGSPP